MEINAAWSTRTLTQVKNFTCFSSRDVVTSTCTKNSEDSKNVAFNFQMRS